MSEKPRRKRDRKVELKDYAIWMEAGVLKGLVKRLPPRDPRTPEIVKAMNDIIAVLRQMSE